MVGSGVHRAVSLLALSAALGAATPARAQRPADRDSTNAPPALDPGVAYVVTGGLWESGGRSGRYRVVVVSSGWEHVASRLFVQWLEGDADSMRVVIRSSRAVDSIPPQFSLGQPVISGRPGAGRWRSRGPTRTLRSAARGRSPSGRRGS